jgi:hypothetical protein
MGDLRIAYLNFAELRGVGNSAWETAAFAFISVVALTNEICSRDNQEVKLWLVGVVILTCMRVLIRWMNQKSSYLVGSEAQLKWCTNSVYTLSTCWFAAGHFLLYEAYATREQYTFLYFLCCQYMAGVYLKEALYHAVHITFMVHPPASAEDQAYVANAQYVLALLLAGSEPQVEEAPKYHPMRYTYWGAWLEGHACLDVAHELVLPPGMAEEGSAAAGDAATTEEEAKKQESHTAPGKAGETAAAAGEESTAAASAADTGATAGDKTDKPADGAQTGEEEDYPRRWDGMRDYTVRCDPNTPPVSALDVCGICLDTLRTKKQYGEEDEEEQEGEGIQGGEGEGTDKSVADIAQPQNSQERQGVKGENEQDQQELPWRLVSRYPCGGRHYFHADCLCVWLEEADRRRPSGYGRQVPVTQAICPCCRRGPPEWPKEAYEWPED